MVAPTSSGPYKPSAPEDYGGGVFPPMTILEWRHFLGGWSLVQNAKYKGNPVYERNGVFASHEECDL
jgi:hypothetical protein